LLFDKNSGDHGRLHQNNNRGALADQASVRGLRLDRNSERRLPRSKMPLTQRIVASGKLIGKPRTDEPEQD